MRETFIALIIFLGFVVILSPEKVGQWAGKASAAYFETTMDAFLGAKQ